ncbi:MAG: SapC family protein [Syntrophales bacterium]|nr:SapC family protein [Syntrophales bacterium]
MTENAKFPQFYKSPVVLDREMHSGLTISPSPGGYLFAASAQTVIIATVEFFEACRQFPIIFAETANNVVVPLALMGLENGENLFVDDRGNWLGSYIPAYIRRYPFITTDGSDGNVAVCFDEAYDGFHREGGIPLFENGQPSPKLNEIMAFLNDYYGKMKETQVFCATVANAGLLRQIEAKAELADGRSFVLDGMLVVDEQRLMQLLDVDIVRLFRSGMLSLINAHLISLRNLNVLMERKSGRA